VLAILGLTAVIVPIPVPPGLTSVDLVVFAGAALALLAFLAAGRIGRGGGLALLAAYVGYVAWLALGTA
jgi:cation:H+ antiporter